MADEYSGEVRREVIHTQPTSAENFPERSPRCCAIPLPVFELILALGERQFRAFGCFCHNLRLFSANLALLSGQSLALSTNTVWIHNQWTANSPES